MKAPGRGLTAALLALALIPACFEGASTPSAEGVPSPASSPAAADPDKTPATDACVGTPGGAPPGQRVGGEVSGDADGDGSEDVVYVVRNEAGAPGCQAFVVAETASGLLITSAEDPGVSYALQAPRVNSLVQVDGSGGLEILVDLEQGASTQFLGMFTVLDGELHRVRIRGRSAYGDLFPYGGSVGHLEASNCTDEGGAEVSISMATPNTTDYRIRRVLYDMQGAVLQPLPRRAQPPVATGENMDRWVGFNGSPFGDCSTSP